MIIAAIVSLGYISYIKSSASLSNAEIEQRARALGMDYPSEFKVINDKGVKK